MKSLITPGNTSSGRPNQQAREILQEAKEVADDTIRIFQKAGPGASLKDLEKSREKLRGK